MNWGHKLTLAFVASASMMIFLVVKAFQTDFELVEKEYYNKELQYQQVIDGKKLAAGLTEAPLFLQKNDTMFLQMPKEFSDKKIEGKLWFYCSYAAANDKKFAIESESSGTQVFTGISKGLYIAKLEWTCETKPYYFEKQIRVE